MAIATPDRHDYELVRTNERTGKDYSVWVFVGCIEPPERQTPHHQECAGAFDALAWGSLGQTIELTDGEMNDIHEIIYDC